jgi:hypothetical protein
MRGDYALETQTTVPIYPFAPERSTVVHEAAHQWFGDSVSLERWPDIWLNEGLRRLDPVVVLRRPRLHRGDERGGQGAS